MGLGDEIMATGRAVREGATPERRACILDRHGRPRTHPLWRGNPALTTDPAQAALMFQDGGGCRPYIDHAASTSHRWAFRLDHRPTPGRLYGLRPDDRLAAARAPVLIEPTIKAKASPNKQWGRANWQALVTARPGVEWVQVGPDPAQALAGVRFIRTGDFEAALSVLAACRMAVLPEGGLHHAAAALTVPAVVLFGGFMPSAVTGYPAHINLAIDRPDAVGWRIPHPACADAWAEITVPWVAAALDAALACLTLL